MSYNKNVVEDALFQIRNLEETLQENAKGILQSTMSEEIKQLVKESLREQDEVDTTADDEEDDEAMMAATGDMESDDDMTDDDDEMAMDDDEMAMDDEDMAMDDEDMAMDDEDMAMDDEDAIDMTDASDEEVLRVFRAMGDDDGIVVKKEGDFIHLTDDDDDYLIQLGEQYEDDLDEDAEMPMDLDEWGQSEYDDMSHHFGKKDMDETIYEIEMDDLDDLGGMMKGKKGDFYEQDEYGRVERGSVDDDDWWADKENQRMWNEQDDLEMDLDEDYESLGGMEEDIYESIKKSVTPKGVGIGRGPKFSYDKKPNMGGGFNEKRKEAFGKGTKAMGTGKARFEYKEEKSGVLKKVNSDVKKEKTELKTKRV